MSKEETREISVEPVADTAVGLNHEKVTVKVVERCVKYNDFAPSVHKKLKRTYTRLHTPSVQGCV